MSVSPCDLFVYSLTADPFHMIFGSENGFDKKICLSSFLPKNTGYKSINVTKGGGFYDKLGADVCTKNPKKSALGTFIARSG